jgi:O-antigen ligase
MDNAVPWIFIVLVGVVTWISPLVSLYLFVLASPFGAVDALGWDPRTRWAIVLGLRGAWEAWNTGDSRVPGAACKFWAGFTVLAAGGLWIGSTSLLPDELESSRSLLLYFIVGSCGVYAIWQLVRKRQQLRTLCGVFAASVLVGSSIGIAQALTRYRLGSPTDRIEGSLGNPNYFAAYLALAATTLGLLVRLNLIQRWYGCIACAAAMIACGLTLSRIGIIAVLVGVGLAFLTRYERKLLSTRVIAVTGIAAVLGGTLLTAYLLQYRRSLTYSDRTSQEKLAETMQAAEDLSRLEALRYALQLTGKHPFAGIGFGTFQARNYDANGLYVTTHNTVMQILVGTGLLGGVLIIALVFSLVSPLDVQARRRLFPAAMTFGICCLFGDYLQSIEVFVVFAVLYLSVRGVSQAPWARLDQEPGTCAV